MAILALLANVAWLAVFVCCILVAVRLFKEGKTGLGILAIICNLFTLIYGWQNADRLNIKQIMLIMTAAFIAAVVLNGLVFATAAHH